MCMNLLPEDLNPNPYPTTPHKHLYLWSDHHTKGAQWSLLLLNVILLCYKVLNIIMWFSFVLNVIVDSLGCFIYLFFCSLLLLNVILLCYKELNIVYKNIILFYYIVWFREFGIYCYIFYFYFFPSHLMLFRIKIL